MKRSIRPLILVILSIIMLFTLASCKEKPEMKINFFSAKNGDCTVFTINGKALVIDCGNGVGSEISEYLKSENIHIIDTIVISDFTAEHFNGAALLMEEFDVNKIYVPGYFCEGEDYERFMTACDELFLEPTKVEGSVAFALGDASVRVYAALNSIDVEKGDHSLMTRVVLNKCSFLICGDAEHKRLQEFVEYDKNRYDLIKMPSHGAYYESINGLLENADPDYAVITPTDSGNSGKTEQLLDDKGCDIYKLDSKGLVLTCNGKKIEFNE